MGELAHRGEPPDEVLLLVDFDQLGVQVLGDPVGKLGNRVDARGLEQLGELLGHADDPDQVGMVDPAEDQGPGDAGLLGDLVSSLGLGARLEELLHRLDPRVLKLLRVDLADAFDVNDLLQRKSPATEYVSSTRRGSGETVQGATSWPTWAVSSPFRT